MQVYGSETEWTDANKVISSYFSAIKADPHFVKIANWIGTVQLIINSLF